MAAVAQEFSDPHGTVLINAREDPVSPEVFNDLGCPCPAEKEIGPDRRSPSPL